MQNYASLQFSQMERPELRPARISATQIFSRLREHPEEDVGPYGPKAGDPPDRYALDKVLVKSPDKMI